MNLFPDKAGEKAAEDPHRREAIASFMVAVYGDNNRDVIMLNNATIHKEDGRATDAADDLYFGGRIFPY